jgi:hypothetical protein
LITLKPIKTFFLPLLKPLFFWLLVLYIFIEFFLFHNFNKLPYKFLNHTSGPVRLLADYSKKEVIPENYFALVGDSNVYGFGPWLYDNSWSMDQPSFATHHLLNKSLGTDVVAFGYPGYGNLGSSLTAVAQHRYLNESLLWSDFPSPNNILFVFYEGNDLINNLHEIEQRGFSLDNPMDEKFDMEIESLLKSEEQRLLAEYTILDQSPTWNLTAGIVKNYFGKFFLSEEKEPDSINKKNELNVNESISKDLRQGAENRALINQNETDLGYCEGPALLMTSAEIDQSMRILHHSLSYLKNYFSESRVCVVYLPSSLSIYEFKNSSVRPAPLQLNSSYRHKALSPEFAKERNLMLRSKVSEIASNLDLKLIDTTHFFKSKSRSLLLHGPRDPIHLNRKGFETFSEAILRDLRKKS